MIRPEHESLLQCSDCRATLDGQANCTGCGRVFTSNDGCLSMFPGQNRIYTVSMSHELLNPEHIPRTDVFRYPPRSGQATTDLHHLDQAHADIMTNLPKDSLVLEIGCGGGQMRNWAKEHRLRYLGTDISKTRVHEWLRDYGGADLLCDAHSLPFRDNSFDVVYAAAVWEHLAFPQFAAQEVQRVLKPGGLFLGSSSFLEPWHDESYYHNTPNGVYMTLALARLNPEAIWPEVDWPGFKAILRMGNKATKLVSFLGSVMNFYYLTPKKLRLYLKTRKWPDRDALHETRGKTAGAVAWIARKPAQVEIE